MSDEAEVGRIVLTREALIPIGSAGAVVVSFLAGVMWLNGKFTDIDNRLANISNRLDRIEEQGGDRWTRTHQRLWAALMKQGNPALDIPRVEDIAK